jgi:hypothetical protein
MFIGYLGYGALISGLALLGLALKERFRLAIWRLKPSAGDAEELCISMMIKGLRHSCQEYCLCGLWLVSIGQGILLWLAK